MINNSLSSFITYEQSADTETVQKSITLIPVDTDIRCLVAFKLRSKNTTHTPCKSYAIFNPLDLAADAYTENNSNIYIFHFFKPKRGHKGVIIFGENPKIIPPQIEELLLDYCFRTIDSTTMKANKNASKEIHSDNDDDISDDASTNYESSSSDTDSTNSIIDESEL